MSSRKLRMKLGPSLLCFLHIIHGFYGNIELTCGTVNPLLPANVTCVCQYVGNGISWFHPNGTKLVNCFQSFQQCFPTINGFMFSIDSASYRMTIINYRYSDCLYFSCRDISDSTIQISARPSPSEFDSTTPVSLNEPNSNHSNGTITFTTACVFQYSKINYTWYIVSDGSERKYDIDKGRFVFESNNSSCNQCAGDALASLTIGFNHTEAGGKEAQKVLFQVKIHHKEYPLDDITLTSKHAYMVQVNDHRMSTPDNTDDNIYPIVIAAVFGLLLFVLGCVICIFCCRKKIYKDKRDSDEIVTSLPPEYQSLCFKEKEDNKSKVPDQVDDTHGKQENSNHSENDNKPSETQGNDFDNASFLEENNDIQDSNDVNPNTSKVPDQVGDTHGKQENGNQSESDNKPSETQGNDFDNASFLEENNDIQDSNDVNPNTSKVPDEVGDTHGKQENSNHSENDNKPSETQGKDFDNSTYLGENIYDIQDSNDVNPNTSTVIIHSVTVDSGVELSVLSGFCQGTCFTNK
ncbi:uncharacterized protein LOC132738041, partial [Ruditapes philippinarum]|uniref:uncharacterized protein LOC132738041 n=1 Tax=Ruditapes philippinarum TaxID=129788 RepID=UPI00295AED50